MREEKANSRAAEGTYPRSGKCEEDTENFQELADGLEKRRHSWRRKNGDGEGMAEQRWRRLREGRKKCGGKAECQQ